MANRASAERHTVVHLPAGLLGRLTRVAFSGVAGPGSSTRRQHIAVRMTKLLYERGGDLPPETILLLTSEITGALNNCSPDDSQALRADFGFDKDGALCWTPQTLARTLGFELKAGLRRLKSWRQKGQGPKFIKLGTTPQSPVLYPIRSTLEWIESQAGHSLIEGDN